MDINTIVTLEDNQKYLIIKEVFYEENKYFLTTIITKEVISLNDKVKFFVSKEENNQTFLKEIEDEELLSKLVNITKNILD